MKRAQRVKETSEKILKIERNTIFVEARTVSDNYRKVTPANFSVDPKHEKYSLTNNPLGNTWEIHHIKIITVGNESDAEVEEADADHVEVIEAPSLIAKDSDSESTVGNESGNEPETEPQL